MYFKEIKPLNESATFTLANFIDFLIYMMKISVFPFDGEDSYNQHVDYKMEKAREEFKKHYSLTIRKGEMDKLPKEAEDLLQRSINRYNTISKVDEVLDLNILERLLRKRLEQRLSNNKTYREMSLYVIYNILLRREVHSVLDNATSTYTLSLILYSGNPVMIQFDEKEIVTVLTLTTKNNWDIDSELKVVELKVDLDQLNKVLKSNNKK